MWSTYDFYSWTPAIAADDVVERLTGKKRDRLGVDDSNPRLVGQEVQRRRGDRRWRNSRRRAISDRP